jgi:hypothetical protein
MTDLLGVRQECAAVECPAAGDEIRSKRTGLQVFFHICASHGYFGL